MPEHVHSRSDDKPQGIIIPPWAKQAFVMVISIFVGAVAVLGWLDNRYAKQSDLQNMNTSVNEKLDTVNSKLDDLKQYILRGR